MPLNLPVEIKAGNKFGHQKKNLAVIACVKRTDEVLVIEPSEHPNFTSKNFFRLFSRLLSRQHLDGYSTPHEFMLCEEHLPHAAPPNLVEDAILPEVKLPAAHQELAGLKSGKNPTPGQGFSHPLHQLGFIKRAQIDNRRQISQTTPEILRTCNPSAQGIFIEHKEREFLK